MLTAPVKADDLYVAFSRFGDVTCERKFDAAALARAKKAAVTSTPETALIDRLTVGSLVLDGLKFRWTVGD